MELNEHHFSHPHSINVPSQSNSAYLHFQFRESHSDGSSKQNRKKVNDTFHSFLVGDPTLMTSVLCWLDDYSDVSIM